MINVLIIEDEIKTAKELKRLIEEKRDDMEVVAMLSSIKSSVKWLGENNPDLIFSDIQLADGISFEIFRQIKIEAPVIFCTAFDEYAIQAFDANGIDYLLKPIDEEKLEKGLDKFEKIIKNQKVSNEKFNDDTKYKQQLDKLLEQMNQSWKSSLLIYFKDKIIPIKTEDIDYIHSESSIVTVYMNDKSHYIVNYTLENLCDMLNPSEFYRTNRQFIINRKAIANIEHYFTRRLVVKLIQPTPEPIIISKIKASEFLHWVEN